MNIQVQSQLFAKTQKRKMKKETLLFENPDRRIFKPPSRHPPT